MTVDKLVKPGATTKPSAKGRSSWSKPVDLSDALTGEPPPGPTICAWDDICDGIEVRRALFYPNEVHSVFGDPEAMKSWLLLHAATQEVNHRRHVLYLDMEANDRSIVERLRLLGLKATQIKKFFHYYRPDDQIGDVDKAWFKYTVQRLRPTLVVLDGVTEAYSLHGLSISSAEDASEWFRNFSRQFQVKPTADYAGPAIVELDHVVKDKDSRNGWSIGTIHKKAGIKGSAFYLEATSPFGKGKHGISRLICAKDSPGGVVWTPFGKDRRRMVGALHCDATSDDGSVFTYIESPTAEAAEAQRDEVPLVQTVEFRELAHRVWKYIVDNAPCSLRSVRASVVGTNERVADALDFLDSGGFIRNESTTTKQAWVAVDGMEFDPFRAKPKGSK